MIYVCGILKITVLASYIVFVWEYLWVGGFSRFGGCVRLTQLTSSIRNATHLKLQSRLVDRHKRFTIEACNSG